MVVRYRARPRGGDGVVETVSAYGVSEAGAVLLVFGEDARQLLNRFVPGTAVELLSATLEGVARSAAPAPVEGGVGEIGWVVPFAVPVPLRTEDVEAAGLLDAR